MSKFLSPGVYVKEYDINENTVSYTLPSYLWKKNADGTYYVMTIIEVDSEFMEIFEIDSNQDFGGELTITEEQYILLVLRYGQGEKLE